MKHIAGHGRGRGLESHFCFCLGDWRKQHAPYTTTRLLVEHGCVSTFPKHHRPVTQLLLGAKCGPFSAYQDHGLLAVPGSRVVRGKSLESISGKILSLTPNIS